MWWSNIPGQAKNSVTAEETNELVTTTAKWSKLTEGQLSSKFVTFNNQQSDHKPHNALYLVHESNSHLICLHASE